MTSLSGIMLVMVRACPNLPSGSERSLQHGRARARVQAIKGFYIHASVFVLVNNGLFVINAFTSGLAGGVWWFYWPLLGWGIGLGAHALGVFGFGGGGTGRNARLGR